MRKIFNETDYLRKIFNATDHIRKIFNKTDEISRIIIETGNIRKIINETGNIRKIINKTDNIRKIFNETDYLRKIFNKTDYIREIFNETEYIRKIIIFILEEFETGRCFPEFIQIQSQSYEEKSTFSTKPIILFKFWQKTNKYCFQTKAEAYLAVNSSPQRAGVVANVPIRIFLTVFIVRNIP